MASLKSLLFLLIRRGTLPGAAVIALVAVLIGYRRFKLIAPIFRAVKVLAEQVPGPEKEKGLWEIFKEVHTHHADRLNDYLLDLCKKHGKTFHVAHYLIITSPQNVQHILKDNFENYPKGQQFLNIFHDLLGDGIFNANGENWRVQRKTASKIFSRKAFTTFMSETFTHHGHTVLSIFERTAAANSQLDLQDIFFQFTLDSIGQIGFGIELDVLKRGKIPFSEAFDQSQARLLGRFINPFWALTDWVSGEALKQKARIRLMTKFTQDIIRQRRKEGLKDRADILSFFMERTDENGLPYTDQYLQDIVMNFIIAGRDTTAITLSWTFYTLATEPEVERKLLEEIDSVLQGNAPNYDDVDTRLPYLHAVIKEVLRLYPPVPKDIKTATNDDTLPDGTFVPAGTGVVYVPYVMARLEEHYENPLKVDPERWFQAQNSKKTLFEYPVFQAGPRTCLGMHMAYFESKLLTAMILQKYLVRVKPGFVAKPAESTTMPIAGGLPVTIHERKEFYFNNSLNDRPLDILTTQEGGSD